MSPDTDIDAGTRIHVYLVGTCPGIDGAREALSSDDDVELLGVSENAGGASTTLAEIDVDVLLFAAPGPALPRDELAALREYTSAPVVLLAPESAPGLLSEALAADVADALLLPQPAESVLFAVHKAGQTRRGAGVAAPVRAHLATVFSPKGGTGKTVIATNLAAAFTKEHGRRTLLIDLDLQFGDCAIVMGAEPHRTVYDLVTAPGELDSDKLAGYTTPLPDGLDLLAAPRKPEEAEFVTAAKVIRLFEVARESYEMVVIDSAPFLHGPVLAALDHSDLLLLVATLDVPTLKDVRQSLETLELLSFPPERVALVLNRATAQVGIKRSDVEAGLGLKIRFALPDDRAVPLAVNRGNPAVLAERTSEFAAAIRSVSEIVLAEPLRTEPRSLAQGRS